MADGAGAECTRAGPLLAIPTCRQPFEEFGWGRKANLERPNGQAQRLLGPPGVRTSAPGFAIYHAAA